MSTKLLLGLTILLLSLNACAVQQVNMKIRVHEESGAPVESALVRGSFYQDRVVNKQLLDSHQGLTNEEGVTELSGHEELYVDLTIKKKGYYNSEKRVVVRNNEGRDVSVLLRPKKNPIAMYAKNLKLVIPERGREFGFDFFKGDFVMPGHGGSHADVKIMFNRNLINNDDFTQTVSLSFANPTDGVAEMETNEAWNVSDFKTPYNAVENTYESDLKLTYSRKKTGVSKSNINVPFFVRLRSSADKEGNIEAAYYCKIFSGIELYGVLADNPSLKMTYYCNPTLNDRNVEFNPRQNLFKNLKHLEKVDAP